MKRKEKEKVLILRIQKENRSLKATIATLRKELDELKDKVPGRYLCARCSVCGEPCNSSDSWSCLLCEKHYCGHPECNKEYCGCE